MRKIVLLVLTSAFIFFSSCGNGQSSAVKTNLTAAEFSERVKATPEAQILDVRTADEFSGGHLVNAINIDWNQGAFGDKVEAFDKNKPVFIYCLSGARSAAAADNMRKNGFKEVVEMKGGILSWRAENLPEQEGNATAANGMNVQEFEAMIDSNTTILVDFYADWCAPCKLMEPYLNEISTEMADSVQVIRINADKHPQLCADLKVTGLPVLHIYKNKKLTWTNLGFISKDDVVKELKK